MQSGTKPVSKRVAEAVTGKHCPICLNRVEIRLAAAIIPCLHAYCIGCIRRWSDFKRKCPLCNANFSSWVCKIDSNNYQEEKLSTCDGGKKVISVHRYGSVLLRRRRVQLFEQRRLIRRSREASRGRPQASALPRLRSFGRENYERSDVISERAAQWRASIYERRLQAVPLPRNGIVQQIVGNNGAKEKLLRRIEPWIKRELEAVLGDPDPTVIVHVATSLFILQHENSGGQIGNEDDFLAPLRPFLRENTEIFWHELKCYAGSSFSMETYDTVVEYKGVLD